MIDIDTIEVRTLRFFIELARVGNFGRAAARAGITQSAMTQAINRLEKSLGFSCFIRHSRGVVLTEQGIKALDLVTSALKMLSELEAVSQTDKEPSLLTVGLPISLGPSLTGPLFRQIKASILNCEAKIIETDANGLENGIQTGALDMAILYNPPKLDDIVSLAVLSEDLYFVYPPVWNLSLPRRPLHIREIADLPIALSNINQSDRRVLVKVEAKANVRLRPILEIDSLSTLTSFVNSGAAATISTLIPFVNDIKRGALLHHDIEHSRSQMNLNVTFNKGRKGVAIKSKLAQIALSCIQDILESGDWPGAKSFPKSFHSLESLSLG